jgi:lipoyl(octanoyl) transferase
MRHCHIKDLGLIDYQNAWEMQKNVHQQLIDNKIERRSHPHLPALPHQLWLLEHPHVYTLGRSGSERNLLLDTGQLDTLGASFYKINRGGDITYHGPGQLVVYALLDLDHLFTDVHLYVRTFEQAVIDTLEDFGISGTRIEGYTGVWLDATGTQPERKICALGVHLGRWVSMHGIGFNVNTQLGFFEHIVPCGISPLEKSVTSMQHELGAPVNMSAVKTTFAKHFVRLFELDPIYA